MRWGQRAVREEKTRGGTARAATAFRHVTFLFTSGCNTHARHYWLSLTPLHRHIRPEGLWPAYAQACTHKSTYITTKTWMHFETLQTAFSLFFHHSVRKIVSAPFYLISSSVFPAELQQWFCRVAEGIQSCPNSLVTQHYCMFPYTPRETWSQYLQAYTHVLTHRGTGSTGKTKSENVCGPSGSVHASLEGRGVGGGGTMRQGAETIRDRWTGLWTQTECLRSGQYTGRWERPSKFMQHKCCCRDTSQRQSVAWKVAAVHVCVSLCWVCLLTVKVVMSLFEGGL